MAVPESSIQYSSRNRGRPWWLQGYTIHKFLRNKAAVSGLVIFLLIALGSVFAPWITPYQINQPDVNYMLAAPSIHHLMGTDQVGADLFTEVLYGGRISLAIGVVSALVAVTVGGTFGVVAGYYGGIVDTVLMRLTDMALSIPLLFIVLLLSIMIGANPFSLITIIGLTSWMYPARIVRSQVLSIRSAPYVESARSIGSSNFRIMLRTIMPNSVAPLIVNTTLLVGQSIITESIMSFLGVGLAPPFISWGYLLNQAQAYITVSWWLAFFPGVMIFIVVLSVNFIGDGLRDALDPEAIN